MVNLCFYFQVHQPYRMKKYRVFDIGSSDEYFDEEKNKAVMEKVASKCYVPTTKMLLRLLEEHPDFKIAFSFSGVFIEQARRYSPDVLNLFKRIAKHPNVEILGETYYHSLAFLRSKTEFANQIKLHKELIQKEFNKTPRTFRNTELIYSNWLSDYVAKLGFKIMLAEGIESILGWRSPNYVYSNKSRTLTILLKNYQLSDDIAFRFSDKNWKEWPLTAEKYLAWIKALEGNSDYIGLFMDYETFGEHQWTESGIFDFFEHFIKLASKHGVKFINPINALKFKPRDAFDCEQYLSWADTERDLSAWQGNRMQDDALEKLYLLENKIKQIKRVPRKLAGKYSKLLSSWRKLQTSDHFYYMCTKYFNDGDVHKYFNPYDNPYDAYIYFMNILSDLNKRFDDFNVELKQVAQGFPKSLLPLKAIVSSMKRQNGLVGESSDTY